MEKTIAMLHTTASHYFPGTTVQVHVCSIKGFNCAGGVYESVKCWVAIVFGYGDGEIKVWNQGEGDAVQESLAAWCCELKASMANGESKSASCVQVGKD